MKIGIRHWALGISVNLNFINFINFMNFMNF
jgi:hypothetical protein